MSKKILSLLLCLALCLSMVATLSGCSGKKGDAFVIMTDSLDGLFNPFYATSGNDVTITGMTQIGMLGAAYKNGEVEVAYGDEEPVVAKDYEIIPNEDGTVSYYFVLKNGIKFSDGHPLTMGDVLFNLYTYLDPVYTGSNTLYSTKIVGLSEYRTQTIGSSADGSDTMISQQAANRAQARLNELINLFRAEIQDKANSGEVVYDTMVDAIKNTTVSSGYQSAISNNPSEITNEQLLADYEYALKLFKEELGRDYVSAQESYKDAPYDQYEEFKNEVFCFMYTEGYVEVEYELDEEGKKDRTKIKSMTPKYNKDTIKDKDAAINYVYNDKIATELDIVLSYWATAGELQTEYAAKAKEVILHENVKEDGSLAVPNISGIVSLGHSEQAGQVIKINGTDYTIASEHDADGVVVGDAYDVLKITLEGVDPKAIWNFSVTIAPQHYYGEGSSVGVDIANNQFGVEYANFDFHSKIIQSVRNNKIPMGAGVYKASDENNSDTPAESDFYKSNVVYFKANNQFETVGASDKIHNAYIEKVRYQVVSSNNAIPNLENGTVHYITPSLTNDNYTKLTNLESKGYKMLSTDQLGYGYIGVNASKINDLNVRRAIMCAMNTSLALDYYRAGTADQIFWNMSQVSWAYPQGDDKTDNGKDYPMMGAWSEEDARTNIDKYMREAGVAAGDPELKVTFTIAGSTLQDHPTYKVFRDAAALLNDMGWDIEVVCDTQALTKISTGSLEVWAAAWSSSLDPDMYQVYHKDSQATSVKAWGYPYLLKSGSSEELKILDEMAELIDAGRETNDKEERKEIYKQAMGYVLDLAVELPVYQRDVLYAYNANIIDAESMPGIDELNPYSSPLDRMWEIKFAE